VFDGHGGKEVAEYCRRHFNEYLKQTKPYQNRVYLRALEEGFLMVDDELEKEAGKMELAEMKRKNPPNKSPLLKLIGDQMGNGANGEQTMESMMLDSIGCTANVILVEPKKRLVVANAGDSRSVLCRGGKALPLSEDHKPDNEEEKARIEKAGSYI